MDQVLAELPVLATPSPEQLLAAAWLLTYPARGAPPLVATARGQRLTQAQLWQGAAQASRL